MDPSHTRHHPRIEAVSLDAGHTLLRVRGSVGQIYARVARQYGFEVSPEEANRRFRTAFAEALSHKAAVGWSAHTDTSRTREWWRRLVERVFLPFNPQGDIDGCFTELYEVFSRPDQWVLFPEVPEVLAQLRRRRLGVGLVSNWDERLEGLLDGLGLTEHLDFILISSLEGVEKPAVEIFHRAARRAGVAPQHLLHVGDSYVEDYLGARRAGVQALLLDRDGRAHDAGGNGVARISSLRDVPPWVDGTR